MAFRPRFKLHPKFGGPKERPVSAGAFVHHQTTHRTMASRQTVVLGVGIASPSGTRRLNAQRIIAQ